ncbi:MAG: type CRISPR-associated protein Cas8c/Csd1 [Verrucomicrobiota bacterium]|jgi:CRISPR-associated protein Csd1
MILQALDSLYDRLAADESYDIAEDGFAPMKISYVIVIDINGDLKSIDPLEERDANGKSRQVSMLCPSVGKRTIRPDPIFLADKSDYVLGRNLLDEAKAKGSSKIQNRHERFKKLHIDIASNCSTPELTALNKFLSSWKPRSAAEFVDLEKASGANFVFKIEGEERYIHEVLELRIAWQNKVGGNSSTASEKGFCLISGKQNNIAKLHYAIKGVVGAQSSGAALVSFNQDAFTSYGKEQNLNAPVGETAAFRYATALNALLSPAQRKHRALIGGDTVVFWTEKPTMIEDVFALAAGADSSEDELEDKALQDKLSRFYDAVRQGGNPAESLGDEPTTPFYILGLAPNAARLAVRYFHRSSVGEIGANLARHFADIGIVRMWEPGPKVRHPDSEFPTFRQLLRQTAREAKEIPPLLAGALMRSVFANSKYPEALASTVLRRISIERDINHPKAAILKGWLVRNHADWLKKHSITMKQALDKDTPHAAYQLGRLFAAYEQAQRAANEYKLERTIKETMFSAASATPLAVFSRLDRMNKHHLAKLSPGSKKFFNDLYEEIHQKIVSPEFYPSVLDVKQQSLFCIGYYHQMHALKNKTTTEPQSK